MKGRRVAVAIVVAIGAGAVWALWAQAEEPAVGLRHDPAPGLRLRAVAPAPLGGQPVREMHPSGPMKGKGMMPPGPPPAKRGLPDVEFILSNAGELDLSPEQLKELKSSLLKARLEGIELRAEQEKAGVRLEAALDQEKVNLDAVKELIYGAAEAQAALHYLHIALCVKAKEMLTEEQRGRLKRPWLAAPSPPMHPHGEPGPRLMPPGHHGPPMR